MKKRIPWIDDVRFFAILCVILYHVLGMLTTGQLPGSQIVRGGVMAFNMPLFFMISGYVSGNKLIGMSDSRNLWKFCKSSILRLLLPAYAFTLLTIPFDHEVLSNPTIYYWFLHSLFRLYMIVAIASITGKYLRKYIGCYPSIILTIVLCFILAIPAGNMTLEFVSYFLFGIFLKKSNLMDKISVSVTFLLLLAGVMFAYLSWGHNLYIFPARNAILTSPMIWLIRQACGISISVAMCGLCKSVSKQYTTFSHLGTMTLGFYVVHDYIVEMVLKGYLGIALDFTKYWEWAILLLMYLVILSVTYIIIKVIKKLPMLRFVMLGER